MGVVFDSQLRERVSPGVGVLIAHCGERRGYAAAVLSIRTISRDMFAAGEPFEG